MDTVKLRIEKERVMEKLPIEIEKVGFNLGLNEKVKVDAIGIYDLYRGSVDDHVKVTKFTYRVESSPGIFTDATSNPKIESRYHTRVGVILAGSALYLSCLANSTPIVPQSIEREFSKLHKTDLLKVDSDIDLYMSRRIVETSIYMMKGRMAGPGTTVNFVDISLQGLMNNLAHRLQPEQAKRIEQDARKAVRGMETKLSLSSGGGILKKQHLAMAATAVYIAMRNDNERISHDELGDEFGITHGPGMMLYRKCVEAGIVDGTALGAIFRKMRRASRELGLSLETEEKAKQILSKAAGKEMQKPYNSKEHAEMDQASAAAIWIAALDENKKLRITEISEALRNKGS